MGRPSQLGLARSSRVAACPFRFVLGVRGLDAGMARVGALIRYSRDSVDFPPDSGPLNYPCCILYSPLLPHYCRKMYEQRLRYVVPPGGALSRGQRHSNKNTVSCFRCRGTPQVAEYGQQHRRRQPQPELRRERQRRRAQDSCGWDVRHSQRGLLEQLEFGFEPSQHQLGVQQVLARWQQAQQEDQDQARQVQGLQVLQSWA